MGEDVKNFSSRSRCLHFSIYFLSASVIGAGVGVDTVGANAGIPLVLEVDSERVINVTM